jgi:putative cardiolipin synthase
MQYYLWYGDEAGLILAARVVEAANRGVKVRVIVDDLDTMLEDSMSPVVRDPVFLAANMHPDISVRLFNAFRYRTLAGRGANMLSETKRLNQRMHNKQMIVDNRFAIIGGRNLGNEYMGLNETFNFHDLDVLAVGPAARQASAIFDRFWNSEMVTPVAALRESITDAEAKAIGNDVSARLTAAEKLAGFPLDRQDWSAQIDDLAGSLSIGTSTTITDSPENEAIAHHMPSRIRELVSGAKKQVLITNAYLIPDEKTIARLKEMTSQGVEFRVLTNSLASQDVAAVNSHYKQWREPLLAAGAQLHEIRPDAEIRSTVADTPPVTAEFMGLHTKGIVIDREKVFIGSLNLDPRSFETNSEMGIIIASPDLATRLADVMERGMAPENSWRLEIGDDGVLRWISADGVLETQPARNMSQRVQDLLFRLLPKNLY